ncbi:hypothetical protein JMN32_19070 [Fulvivirga sp. 29W222]|uniref:Uncharacterized protein n=1 Tax=Fulvivirga marina TaxID=2494733 RepID=A0A937G0T4_9BACT|nr:hypothetical protein [Fulvivirga marina]MBL6448423.1 hypothetical protein [Fulvivirga marina]
MENLKPTWEGSQERYTMLLEGLEDLIQNTTKLGESYEATNMKFAQLIYENGLTDIMDKAKLLKEYEGGFQFMYYSLKGQIHRHKRFRDEVKLMFIKDPVNCPYN